MKPIIFCGYHNTGKTTLIEKAVHALVRKGNSVSTIKHSPEMIDLIPGEESADSARLFNAGSQVTAFITGDTALIHTKLTPSEKGSRRILLHSFLKLMKTDYILIEGFKSYDGPIPKIVFGATFQDITELLDAETIGYSGPGLHAPEEDAVSLKNNAFKKMTFLPLSIQEERLASFIEEHTVEFHPDPE